MKYSLLMIIYVGFFAVIGLSVYLTESLWALLALLFIPDFKIENTPAK